VLLKPGFEGSTCLARVRHLTVGAGQLVHATFSVFWVVVDLQQIDNLTTQWDDS
jgi:hypothetical protein